MFEFTERINTMAVHAKVTRDAYLSVVSPDIANFALGCPASETLPVEEVREIAYELLDKNNRGVEALSYNNPKGLLQLRKDIVKYMLPKRFIYDADPDDVLVTQGGLETLNMVCQLFINKGDVVLVEAPTFMQAIQIFELFEAKCIGVKCDENGMIIEDLKAKYEQYKPKMVYVIPSFQNPTGATTSLERRQAIADFAAQHTDVIILEDDPYVELRQNNESLPSIKSMDKAGNIIFADSFSKCFAPGVRVGYVYANHEIVDHIFDIKTATNSHTAVLTQMFVAEYFERGLYDEHIKKAIEVYRKKFDAAVDAVQKYMPQGTRYHRPDGGIFFWVELPENAPDTTEMLTHVNEFKVNYTPGAGFFVDGSGHNCLRLSFGNMTTEEISNGLQRLGEYICANMK